MPLFLLAMAMDISFSPKMSNPWRLSYPLPRSNLGRKGSCTFNSWCHSRGLHQWSLFPFIRGAEEMPLALLPASDATKDHTLQMKVESSSIKNGDFKTAMEEDEIDSSETKMKAHPRPPSANQTRKKKKD